MKQTTMKKIINKKINEWLATIEDTQLKEHLKNRIILTGGCFTSMYLDEPVKDFDIYFTDKETVIKVAEYYISRFRDKNGKESKAVILYKGSKKWLDVKQEQIVERLQDRQVKIFIPTQGIEAENPENLYDDIEDITETIEEDEKPKYRPIFLSPNAITLSDGIQLIVRFYGSPEKIHETYDFIHCTNYWTSETNEIVVTKEALDSILTKRLIYTGSLYPVCSIMRIRKFMKRGWKIDAGQTLKMIFQCGLLDLTDINVLEDQLIGVDSAYFYQVIASLKTKETKVEEVFLFKILDKIFE